MPNWCFTAYTLVGSADDAKAAYDALHTVEETKRPGPFEAWSFESHSNWLGYVAEDVLGTPWNAVGCRGSFENLQLTTWKDKSAVVLSTETAWGPCEELMNELARKFRLSLNFHATEPGNQYFAKGGPDEVYTQTLYYYSDDEGEEYFDTLEDFLSAKGERYNLSADARMDEALAAVNDSEDACLHPISDEN